MFLKISRLLIAAFFTVAGANHFIAPDFYLPMMPGYLPWPMALIYLSGVAEIVGGIGVLIPKWRKWAGWWLIAVLIAIFPANIHMLIHDVPLAGRHLPSWVLWTRLPLQLVMIAWVYVSTIPSGRAVKS
jgi:uncharacterized membrane protein